LRDKRMRKQGGEEDSDCDMSEIKKKKGQQAVDKELGPPHLRKGLRLLDFLATAEVPESLKPDQAALAQWLRDIQAGSLEEAMSAIRHCWTATTFDRDGEEPMDRISFNIEGFIITMVGQVPKALPVNQLVDRLLRAAGSVQKSGPPPAMKAERQLKAFSQKLFSKR